MRTTRNPGTWAVAATFSLLSSSCALHEAVPLVNITGYGEQWVFPYFLDGKPTVIAFWSTDEMQCQRDVPALQALDARGSSIELVTAVTGRDRLEIDRWLRRHRIRYVVLLDLEEELAGELGVRRYPTYVYFGENGEQLARTDDIREVRDWYDDPVWLERSGVIAPGSR